MQPRYGGSLYGYIAQVTWTIYDLGQLHQLTVTSSSEVLPATAVVISSGKNTAVYGLGSMLGPLGFAAGNGTVNNASNLMLASTGNATWSRSLLSSSSLQTNTSMLNAANVVGNGAAVNAGAAVTPPELQNCPALLVSLVP